MQYNIKIGLLASILFLSGCSVVDGMGSSSSSTLDNQLTQRFEQLEQKSLTQQNFIYRHNDVSYTAYLSSGKPTLIIEEKAGEKSQFYYNSGSLIGVKNAQGVYSFQNGHMKQGYNASGDELDLNSNETTELRKNLMAQGKTLAKQLGKNRADRGVASVRTGADAKLNYLCIAKVQQVAGTKRVFRSSANQVKSSTQLKAVVRLNGKDYYNMDCRLSGNNVSSLTLMSK